ncbi:MAG TPA: hypothetical protein VJ574_04230 [Candidatus Bathyarchaeia archaeon]|nr:hypothetical protein [Candidatus Bathyarchaeia archaeon]
MVTDSFIIMGLTAADLTSSTSPSGHEDMETQEGKGTYLGMDMLSTRVF